MKKLNYCSAFNNRTGYSISATNIGIELSNLGYDLSLFSIGGISQEPHVQEWYSNNGLKKFCDYKAKALKLWHQHLMLEFPICSERIGFPIFELNKFTDQEKHSLNSLDRLIVCSKWAKEICIANNILTEEKISVCPLGIDPKIFSPRDKSPTDKYIFVNLGKWEKRKAHDILVDIFSKAFTKTDNVELWLLPHNPFLSKDEELNWIKIYKDSPLGNKIKIFPPMQTQQDVANFICRADCAIFPHRAEGWGMENLECMACNLPIITTDYSGVTEYSTKENSYLVDINGLELAYDDKWFFGQGEWAEITKREIDQFVNYMQYCYKYRINTNEEGVIDSKTYTWKNSAKILGKTIFSV